MVVIPWSADESVSVNRNSDCSRETGQFGLGFCRGMLSDILSSVVIPESCNHLLILWVRSGVREEGCQDRVGSLSVKRLLVSKKKSGRMPGWATYTKLMGGSGDRIKESSLHKSGNRKLIQVK